MQTFTLLASTSNKIDLSEFTSIFFGALAIEQYDERSSSNYVGEVYFSAQHEEFRFTIGISDEENHLEFPFWIQVVGSASGYSDAALCARLSMRRKTAPLGMRVVRVSNFGKRNECYVDI